MRSEIFPVISPKKYTDEKIAELGTIFTFKGTKQTYNDLPSSGNDPGDVWMNVFRIKKNKEKKQEKSTNKRMPNMKLEKPKNLLNKILTRR